MRAPRPSRFARRPIRLAVDPLEGRETPSTGGLLDPTFGSGGLATTAWAGNDVARDVLVQADGKIVVAGQSRPGLASDFVVARYHANGTLDTGFGSGGRTMTDFSKGTDTAYAVAVQPGTGGKLLVAGSAAGKTSQVFGLTRYTATGALDTSFGSGGKVMTDVGPGDDRAMSMAVQPDGRILLAGQSAVGGTLYLALVRYAANGALDPTFGTGGKLVTGIALNGGYSASSPDIALRPDGRIVVSGNTNGIDWWVAQFNANGTADTTFGGTGRVTTDVPGRDAWAGGLALQPDGRMVVVGTSVDANAGIFDVTLARYNTDGSLDASFGSGGIQILPTPQPGPGPATRYGNEVAVQADGRIVAGGVMGDGISASIGFAVRLRPDGAVDVGYGTAGTGVVELRMAGRRNMNLYAVAVQPDGKAVFAGQVSDSGTGSTTDLVVARLLPAVPQIGSFTATPNPVAAGVPVALSAAGLTDDNPGATVTQVAFYADANGNGVRDAGDTLLGYGTPAAGTWTATVSTVGWSVGTYTLFAQATDSFGAVGDAVGLDLELL